MALTWRDVSAPDLSGYARAVGVSGAGFSTAMSDLSSALGQFNQQRQDRADAAAIQAASRITDPAAYAKALQNGSILRDAGIDPNMISGNAAEALADRRSTLLQDALSQQGVASSILRDKLFEQKQADDLLTSGLTREETRADRAWTDEQHVITRRGQERAEALYQEKQYVDRLAQRFGDDSLTKNQMAQLILQANLTPEGQAYADKLMGIQRSVLPDIPVDGSGEFSSWFQSTPVDLNAGSTGYGAIYGNASPASIGLTKPVNQSTFAELNKAGEVLRQQTEGKIGAGAGVGTSALGAGQFTNPTRNEVANSLYGPGYESKVYDDQTQREMTLELIDRKKGGDLTKTFASLPHKEPGYYKDWPNERIMAEVFKGESGATVDTTAPTNMRGVLQEGVGFDRSYQRIQDNLSAEARANNGNIDPVKYAQLGDDTREPAVIAAEAIKNNPKFAQATPAELVNVITAIQGKSNNYIKPAQALEVYASTLKGTERTLDGWLDDVFNYNVSDDWIRDDEALDKKIADITQGNILGEASNSRDDKAIMDSLAGYQAKYKEAENLMKATDAAITSGQVVPPAYSRKVYDNYLKARTEYQDALGGHMKVMQDKQDSKEEPVKKIKTTKDGSIMREGFKDPQWWTDFMKGREERRKTYEASEVERLRRLGVLPKPTTTWEEYRDTEEARDRRKQQRVAEFEARNQRVREDRETRQRNAILADREAEALRKQIMDLNAASTRSRQIAEAQEIAEARDRAIRIQRALERSRGD